jgi:AAA domain
MSARYTWTIEDYRAQLKRDPESCGFPQNLGDWSEEDRRRCFADCAKFLNETIIPESDPLLGSGRLADGPDDFGTDWADWEAPPRSNGEGRARDGYEAPGLLPRVITPTPFVYREPSKIPRRQWLYGNHYVRQYVSATFAPGGLGKTSLVLVEAIAMASGRSLLGVPVPKRLRVWYWNGEDPAEETERRIAAILLHFKIPHEEIEGWLFTDTGRKTPVCIARHHKNEVIFTPDAAVLTQAIVATSIDVFILDPFVKTHGFPENDNGAIDSVAREFADIADKTNCAVELTHHVRKAGGTGRAEITADDGRGAGSLKDAGRALRVMNQMAEEEAKGPGRRQRPQALFPRRRRRQGQHAGARRVGRLVQDHFGAALQ